MVTREALLNHCRLFTQPDLHETAFDQLDLHANHIRVIHDEYIPRQCKQINFGENKIAEDGLPFEWPDQIESIFLYDNMIVSADGIHWPSHLKSLDLYKNPLYSMPSPLPETLEELIIAKTEIQTIEKFPENLKIVDAAQSRLYKLPARMPNVLIKAILAENFLSYRGLPGCWGTQLQYLDLTGNRLKSFPTGLPDTLEVLLLNKNQLTLIPEVLPENLKQLNVSHNSIRHIEYTRRKNPIEIVCLENNQLIEKPSSESRWAKVVMDGKNWNETIHQISARQIQKKWRIYRMFPRIRTWKKMAKLRMELYMIALHPDRILQTDDFSKWHHGC